MQQAVKSQGTGQRLALTDVLDWLVADKLVTAEAAEQLKKERRYFRGSIHPLVIVADQKWKALNPPHRVLALETDGQSIGDPTGELQMRRFVLSRLSRQKCQAADESVLQADGKAKRGSKSLGGQRGVEGILLGCEIIYNLVVPIGIPRKDRHGRDRRQFRNVQSDARITYGVLAIGGQHPQRESVVRKNRFRHGRHARERMFEHAGLGQRRQRLVEQRQR